MSEIIIDIAGGRAAARGRPEIICDNPDNTVRFVSDAEYARARVILHTADGETVLTYLLSSGQFTLPSLHQVYGAEISAIAADDTETNAVWIGCTESIKSFDGIALYTFDVYNKIMGFLAEPDSTKRAAIYQALLDNYENPPDPEPFPSPAYIAAAESLVRTETITGTVTLRNGTVLEISDADIAAGSLRINTEMVQGDCLLPGGVPAAEAELTLQTELQSNQLLYAEIELTVHLLIFPGVTLDAPVGIFTVYSAGVDSETGIPLTCYDRMKRLDDIPLSALGISANQLYTPNQIIAMCAEAAEIPYEQDIDFDGAFPNTRTNSYVVVANGVSAAWAWVVVIDNADGVDVETVLREMFGAQAVYAGEVDRYSDLPEQPEMFTAYKVRYNGVMFRLSEISSAVETARDLLMHTVQAVCGFASIDRYGSLTVTKIAAQSSTRTLSANSMTRTRVSQDEYRLAELSASYDIVDDEGLRKTLTWSYQTLWEDGAKAELPNNPLWTVAGDHMEHSAAEIVPGCLRKILDALDPVYFKPFSAEIYDDASFAPGDWITVKGSAAPVTAIQWRYHGTQTLECCGFEAAAGIAKTQAQKEAAASKREAQESSQNMMRDIYLTFMHTYGGLESFSYETVGHYTYAELETEESA